MSLNRRTLLGLAAASSTVALLPGLAVAAEGDSYDQTALLSPNGWSDFVLGSEDAKVTVIEYASPTCPHCATWANDVFPEFRNTYVDNGLVQFINRPFIRNVPDAAVFLVAAMADDAEQYNAILKAYFENQNTWMTAADPRAAIEDIAAQFGITTAQFETALTNQEVFDGLNTVREQALNEFGLTGTPTFYVNGKQLVGDKTLDELAIEIDPLLF